MSIQFTPQRLPLSRPARLIGVQYYDPDAPDEDEQYGLLPNIRCLSVEWREGPQPPVARFRYAFGDPLGGPDDPQRIEDCYPYDASGQLVIENDDRLVVSAYLSDGTPKLMFDGFPSLPQADLDPKTETVSFEAFATPVRESDVKLGGAWYRQASDPEDIEANLQTTDPTRFNPSGHPNASPDDTDNPGIWDAGESPQFYPVFFGPCYPSNQLGFDGKNPYTIREWNVGMAARYVMCVGNPSEKYVQLGDLTTIDATLTAIVPTTENGIVDLSDNTTFTNEPIPVEDIDVTGDPWPVALQRLIEPHGFAFHWVLNADPDGDPSWTMLRNRTSSNVGVLKSVHLQEPGEHYDPGATNVLALKLARDGADVANQHVLDTAATSVEGGFVLAPGFQINQNEEDDVANKADFIEGNTNFTGDNVDKYRVFIFDECLEGHWDFMGTDYAYGSWNTTDKGSLTNVLVSKNMTPPNGAPPNNGPQYLDRRRPAKANLISTDGEGKPLRAQLHVSFDYGGEMPGIWARTGTWQLVPDGAWELLPDQLGIRFTGKDPNNISLTVPGTVPAAGAQSKLNLVEWCTTITTGLPDKYPGYPRFRLTAVIDSDFGLGTVAPRRPSSVTSFVVERRHDERARFQKTVVSESSPLADRSYLEANPNATDYVVRDDTKDAQADADAERWAHESGSFAGTITLNGIRFAYNLGDKIQSINGRDIDLRQNLGAPQNETPVYPRVVMIRWEMDNEQKTILELQDTRAVLPARRRGRTREA